MQIHLSIYTKCAGTYTPSYAYKNSMYKLYAQIIARRAAAAARGAWVKEAATHTCSFLLANEKLELIRWCIPETTC